MSLWTLKNLIDSCSQTLTEIDGKWVPARPINYTCRSFKERCRDAWAVFKGEAEGFIWPEGQ